MLDPTENITKIVDVFIKSKVKDPNKLIYKLEKRNGVNITRIRYDGLPFLMIVNNYKSIMMYTYKDNEQ
jgi:hypothetical protein